MLKINIMTHHYSNNAYLLNINETILSVLIPFYNFTPDCLVLELSDQIKKIDEIVEIIIVDDCSESFDLYNSLCKIANDISIPIKIIRLLNNSGRAVTRNTLAANSSGKFLLFLDSDILPDNINFVKNYISCINKNINFAFGGRSAKRVILNDDNKLHYFFTNKFENISYKIRQASPTFYFMSCNFLIRKSIFVNFKFNEIYSGWGWEDVEWASRVNTAFPLQHIDNFVTHLGLLKPHQILQKYDRSINNFKLTLQLHPSIIKDSNLFLFSSLISSLKLTNLIKNISRILVLNPYFPIFIRIRGLQFYKASIYSSFL